MKILVNGTFDLLHTGHLDLINYAKSLGNYLLVAIDSDCRIKLAKGQDRPLNSEKIRKAILENLKAVDKVVIFSSDEELVEILKDYNPDIRVIGSDWKGKEIVGEAFSGTLMFFDR
jgi:rfaE bifunctional protein nucleotidyltransferase chain/domain